MALEARLLKRSGYQSSVAINMHPLLVEWADELRKGAIPVMDFAPAPFMEQWRWRHLNRLRAKYLSSRFLRRIRPDLIHVFLPWTDFGGTRLWLADYCGIPSVISVRQIFSRGTWTPWHKRHYREAFRSVRGIYAISASAMEHFLGNFEEFIRPNTVTAVIHNGVDTHRFRPRHEDRAAIRQSLGLPQDALVMGTVARLAIDKRPKALLSVFAKLKEKYSKLYFVWVGAGPMAEEMYREVSGRGLSGSFVFAGFRNAVEDPLQAMDLFILLSRREGFGTVTAEAMACGLPVVGSDVPGTHEILEGQCGGILVPLEDERAIVAVCTRLLDDQDLRKRMGEAGREQAVKYFDQRIWESRILDFYDKVMGQGPHAG